MRNKILILLLALSLCSGCAILPGNDKIVVRSQQAQEIATDTFDAFLKAERIWESKQVDPTAYRTNSIHHYAEIVRKYGISWINAVKVATRTYKTLKNDVTKQAVVEAQAKLDTELNTVKLTLSAIPTTGGDKGL